MIYTKYILPLKTIISIFFSILILSASSCHKDEFDKDLNGKIYVANEEDGTVSVIDANSLEVVRTINLEYKHEMYMAHNIQVAPDGRSVWITAVPMNEGGEEYAMVIRRNDKKVRDQISLGNDLHLAHIVLDDESNYAYATGNEHGEIFKIDVDKCKYVNHYSIGSGTKPHGLRYMNGKLYVACMGSGQLAVVDAVNGSAEFISVGGIAVQTAVCPILGSVFVSVYDLKQVVRYNVSSGDTTQIRLPVEAQGPIQLYPSPDNSRVYVCDQGIVNGNPSSNKLYVIDTGTNSVVGTVVVGNGAHGVCVNRDGSRIYVTNVSDNSVSVVDGTTLSVIKTIPVGLAPNGISVMDGE